MNPTITSTDIFPLLQQLQEHTADGSVRWKAISTDAVSALLRSVTFVIRQQSTEPVEYAFEIVGMDGRKLESLLVGANDFACSLVQELYSAGRKSAISALVGQIKDELTNAGDGDDVPTCTTTTPPPPDRPSDDIAVALFKKMAGRWHLDFGRGSEDIRIDDNGLVFIEMRHGSRIIASEIRPKFRIEVLEASADLSRIEIAKVELNGRIRQIEVLSLDQNKMEGYAKHDGHKLNYSRHNA